MAFTYIIHEKEMQNEINPTSCIHRIQRPSGMITRRAIVSDIIFMAPMMRWN